MLVYQRVILNGWGFKNRLEPRSPRRPRALRKPWRDPHGRSWLLLEKLDDALGTKWFKWRETGNALKMRENDARNNLNKFETSVYKCLRCKGSAEVKKCSSTVSICKSFAEAIHTQLIQIGRLVFSSLIWITFKITTDFLFQTPGAFLLLCGTIPKYPQASTLWSQHIWRWPKVQLRVKSRGLEILKKTR